jgi:Flp pilus assembly protein TadG
LAFAVSAIVILGFVGLGTEVGNWYLVRREAQNTADASAIAGALAAYVQISPLEDNNPGNAAAAAEAAATALAATNGFINGGTTTLGTITVTPNYYPQGSGSYNGIVTPYLTNNNPANPYIATGAAQVLVSESVAPMISGLFGGTGLNVGAQAVAVVKSIGNACALALTGDLTVSGTLDIIACGLASNAIDSTAINVTGSALALTATTPGSGCCGPGATLVMPAAGYHPPTPNPFTGADAIVFPAFAGASCAPAPTFSPGVPTTLNAATYQAPAHAFCSDVTVAAGQTLWFTPGTYIFYNASLIANAGTIQCTGCSSTPPIIGVSLAFIGSNPALAGTLTIGPSAVVNDIEASPSNATYPALSGILFYGQGSRPVSISLQGPLGAAAPKGAIYFPNAALTFTSSASNPSRCMPLVAGSITLYSGPFSLFVDACPGFGTAVPQMLGARIVE